MPTVSTPAVSILLPCHNESAAIPDCLKELSAVVSAIGDSVEVIVINNASDARTSDLLTAAAAKYDWLRVIDEQTLGYGSACLAGLSAARGQYLFIADMDGSYSFADIPAFLAHSKQGFDFVIGNRFALPMEPGAMPWLHRYLGNPVLSFIVRLCTGTVVKDVHCGARCITRSAYQKLQLQTTGMEFASEMVIKAARRQLRIAQLPIHYRCRQGTSKLQPVRDAWRHVRFTLLYSPLYLFFLPGILSFSAGILSLVWLYFFTPKIFGISMYVHPMFLSAFLVILGYQLVFFAAFSKIYAVTHLGDSSRRLEALFQKITIERVGFAGLGIFSVGLAVYGFIFAKWLLTDFGALNETKNAIVALLLSVLGIQTFFSAFMLSTLGIKER